MIAQDRVRVGCFVRDGSDWRPIEVTGLDAILHLEAAGGDLGLREVDDGVSFGGETVTDSGDQGT